MLSLTASKVRKLPYLQVEICTFGDMSAKVKKAQKVVSANDSSGLRKWLQKNRLGTILFLLVFVVYGNGIFNEYALDDEFYTAGSNKFTQKGIKGIPEIFTTRTFYNTDGSGYSYRPVALTTFALEIQFFGEKPHTSHFINVLLFAITVILLFKLLLSWFGENRKWFAFIVTVLFLVHPIHTETVDNIKCRDELLALLFAVLMMRAAWKHCQTGSWIQLCLSALFTICGLLSKTTMAPVMLLSPFAAWYFSDKKWYRVAAFHIPVLIAVVAVKLAVASRLPEMSRVMQGFENPLGDMSKLEIMPVAFYVLARYFWLMIIPHPLIFYYGLNEVPLAEWSNTVTIAGVVIYTLLTIIALMEFKKRSLAGFGLIFYLGNILLFSNLFGKAPGLMAERFATIASIGFCIAAVDFIYRAFKIKTEGSDWKSPSFSRLRTVLIVLICVYSVRTIARNEAWENKEVLYRNDVELAPESAKINMLLGSYLSSQAAQANFESQKLLMQAQQMMMQGNGPGAQQAQQMALEKKKFAFGLFRESRDYYQVATEVFPNYYTAWSNLGTAYYFTQEYRGGIPYFKKAITIKKDYAEGYFNIGMSYEQLSMKDGKVNDSILLDSCVWYFNEGLKQDPTYVNTADQLSRVYMTHYSDSAAAMKVLRSAVAANPKSDVPYNAMSNIYLQVNDTVAAATMLERAAAVNPENINRLEKLAVYFFRQGNAEKGNYYQNLAAQKNKEKAAIEKRVGKRK